MMRTRVQRQGRQGQQQHEQVVAMMGSRWAQLEQAVAMMGSRRVQLEQAVAMRGSHRCYSPRRYAGVVAKTGTRCRRSRLGCPWATAARMGSPPRLLASQSQVERGTRTGWGKEVFCPALVQGLVAKGSWAAYREQQAGEWERWMVWRVAAMGRTRLPACSGCQKL